MGQLPKHFCSGGSDCSGTNYPCRFASGAQLSPAQLQGLVAQIWGDKLQGRKGGAPSSSSLRLFLSLCIYLETLCVPGESTTPQIPQGAAQLCCDSPGMLPEHPEIHPPFPSPALDCWEFCSPFNHCHRNAGLRFL